MSLEDIVLSEISQGEKDEFYIIPLISSIRAVKIIRTFFKKRDEEELVD